MSSEIKKGFIRIPILITIIVGIFVVVWAGYFLLQRIDIPKKFYIDYAEHKFLAGGQIEYACDAIAYATLFEYPVYKKVEASSGDGTDKVAFAINHEEKYVRFITGASVGIGVSEGAKFAITNETDTHIMAVLPSTFGVGVDTLIFDKKNANAIWTKTRGDALGLSGQSYFLECR